MRLTRIAAGGELPWHSDAPEENYLVRLHIPIRTNSGCKVCFEQSDFPFTR